MAESVTPITKATDTFDDLFQLANTLVDKLATVIVTTDTSTNGAVTTGNAHLSGILSATTLVAVTALRGGTVNASANLAVSSNLIVSGSLIKIGNVSLNATAVNVGANLTLTPDYLFVGNSTVNAVVNTSGFYQDGIVLTAPTILVDNTNIASRTIWNFIGANGVTIEGTDDVVHGQVNIVFSFFQTLVTGGPNTSILFNDSDVPGGNGNFTFDKVTSTVALSNTFNVGANVSLNTTRFLVGNSTANLFANSILLKLANSSGQVNVTPTQILVGANVVMNLTSFGIGNSTVSIVSNSSLLSITDATGQANIQATQIAMGITSLNGTAILIGANAVFDSAKWLFGNSTVNSLANSTILYIANSSSQVNVTPTQVLIGANVSLTTTSLSVGNSTANLFTNSTFLRIANSTNQVNVTPTDILLGSNVTLNVSSLSIGNSTLSTLINQTGFWTGNSTQNAVVNSSGLFINNNPLVITSTQVYVDYNAQSVSYVVTSADNGKVVRITNTTAKSITFPNSLPQGWSCVVEQGGAGQITLTAGSGTTLNIRDAKIKLFGQYSQASVMCRSNANGTAAILTGSGDLTT